MFEKFTKIIRRANTWVLTLLIALTAVGLTNGLNYFFSRLLGGTLHVWAIIFGSIDAALITFLVGPILINTYKHAFVLTDLRRDLEKEIGEQKIVGEAAERRASSLAMINDLSMESSLLSADSDFVKRIADKLQTMTQAVAVAISLYEPESQSLVTRYVAIPPGILDEVSRALGFEVIGMRSPVRDEMLKKMTSEVASTAYNLSEITFGAVAPAVSSMIQSAFGVTSFTALAFLNKGQLWGAAVIANRMDQEPMDQDVARILSHVVAVILQRYEAEQNLQKRESNLRLITDNMVDIVNQVDAAFRLVFVSPSAKRMIGFDATDIIGRPALDFIHPDDIGKIRGEFRAAYLNHVTTSRLEVRLRKADGGYIWTESEIRFLYDEKDVFNGAVIGSRNIDERKTVESDRRKLIQDLAAKNKELEQFTYSVSHDLRSPLITIQGFTGYIRKDLANHRYERVDQDASRIEETAKKMQMLLDELLELSRIGRIMNPPQNIAFGSVVEEALKLVSGRIQAASIQVEVAPILPIVVGDRTRLAQVMQNLIENAVKFMGGQQEPRVEIGTRGVDPDGRWVLYVRDNGMGIAPHNIGQIFDLFRKLDASQEGSGIGLTIVKRIVELHGGRIWVESEGSDRGACFCFTLEGSDAKIMG